MAFQAFAGLRYSFSQNWNLGLEYRYLVTDSQRWDVEWWSGGGFTIGVDSIALTGEGNASFAAVGSDGLLYVMSTGDYFSGEGRLSVVDPLARAEVASFAGFGTGPGNVAADADSRIFVSSYSEGVMEFNLDSNKVVRGAGHGVPIPSNATVAVDSKGRVYGIQTGPCSGGQVGTAHVLDEALEETGTIALGECPVGSAVVQIPPE